MVRREVAKSFNINGIWNAFHESKVNNGAAMIIVVGREVRSNYIKFREIGEILNKGTVGVIKSAVPIPVMGIKVSENNYFVAKRI
jgi:hypothetical protein